MLWYVILWLFSAAIGYWSITEARKFVVSRRLCHQVPGVLSVPIPVALLSGTVSAGGVLLVRALCPHLETGLLCAVFLPAFLLAPVALVLSVVDVRWRLLPNRILFPVAVVLLPTLSVLAFFQDGFSGLARVWAVGISCGVALLLASFCGLGMGDVKLGFLLAAWLGLYAWLAAVIMLFFASLLGGVFALVAMACHRVKLNSHIAFGPWLIAGAYLTWVLYLPTLLNHETRVGEFAF